MKLLKLKEDGKMVCRVGRCQNLIEAWQFVCEGCYQRELESNGHDLDE